MAITSGIFSSDVNYEQRLTPRWSRLGELVAHLKGIGLKIVLTSGSFDLVHLGHVKYLAKAKQLGDVLVVGVDGDAKIRARKGADRPMVPEQERLEMLAHQRPVDLIYLKADDEARWALIKTVRPDVLVLTEDHSYAPRPNWRSSRSSCGEVQVLERQASVTTSERIRQLYMHLGEQLGPRLAEVLPDLIDDDPQARMSDCVVAYVPVLHEGYRRFLERHAPRRAAVSDRPGALRGLSPAGEGHPRASPPSSRRPRSPRGGSASGSTVLDAAGAAASSPARAPRIAMPAEDVSYQVAERFFARCEVRLRHRVPALGQDEDGTAAAAGAREASAARAERRRRPALAELAASQTRRRGERRLVAAGGRGDAASRAGRRCGDERASAPTR